MPAAEYIHRRKTNTRMFYRNLTLLSALCLVGTLAAQPTLDATNMVPVNGQEFPLRTKPDWSDVGPTGANVNWPFWTLHATGNRNYRYFDPSITPTSASIPTATLVGTDGGTDTSFFAVTANGWENVGVRSSLEGVINYTDPVLDLKFPCSFGTTWTDAASASYTVSGFPTTRVGTITGNADAWGQLTLSENDLSNVLRVHVRKQFTDQAAIATINRVSNTWYFFNTGFPYPVLKMVEDSVIINGGAPSVARTADWMGGPGGVGMDDIGFDDVQFTPYPNPATDQVTIQLPTTTAALCEVLDATGKVVRSQRLQANATQHLISVQELTPGAYTARVSENGTMRSVRFIVQR